MIIISVRQDFWDNNRIAPQDEIRKVTLSNVIKEHGAYKTADPVYRYIAGELSGSETAQFITLSPP